MQFNLEVDFIFDLDVRCIHVVIQFEKYGDDGA